MIQGFFFCAYFLLNSLAVYWIMMLRHFHTDGLLPIAVNIVNALIKSIVISIWPYLDSMYSSQNSSVYEI